MGNGALMLQGQLRPVVRMSNSICKAGSSMLPVPKQAAEPAINVLPIYGNQPPVKIADKFIRVGNRTVDRVCRNCAHNGESIFGFHECYASPKSKMTLMRTCGSFELTDALKNELNMILKMMGLKFNF